MSQEQIQPLLSFPFRGRQVPVSVAAGVPMEHAAQAVVSSPFCTWYQRCEQSGTDKKRIDIHSVEIQSVDMFGARCVGENSKGEPFFVDDRGLTHSLLT